MFDARSRLAELTEPASPTLFGWSRQGSQGDVSFAALGVRYDLGNPIAPGAREAPDSIRLASASCAPPRAAGIDQGNLVQVPGEDPAATLSRLGEAVEAVLEQSQLPLILGGDHSLSFPVVERLQRRGDLAVVWCDAHTDFSPWDGRGAHDHKQVLRRISGLGGVRRIVQVGLRGYTLEDELRLAPGVAALRPGDLRRDGARKLLRRLPRGLRCYVSVDIDVLDPSSAPGTSTPVPGGLSLDELVGLLRSVLSRRRVAGLDLVEVNPSRDRDARTSLIACYLLHGALEGWCRTGLRPGSPPR